MRPPVRGERKKTILYCYPTNTNYIRAAETRPGINRAQKSHSYSGGEGGIPCERPGASLPKTRNPRQLPSHGTTPDRDRSSAQGGSTHSTTPDTDRSSAQGSLFPKIRER